MLRISLYIVLTAGLSLAFCFRYCGPPACKSLTTAYTQMDASDAPEQHVAQISNLNREIYHHWTTLGQGYPMEALNDHIGDLLASPTANCSQQAYLFARRVEQKGFRARRVALWASDGNNDVMVEVKVGDRWFLFAPAEGGYYEYSLADIMANPKLAEERRGLSAEDVPDYMQPSFFKTLREIKIYHSLNEVERDKVVDADAISDDNFFPPPNNVKAILNAHEYAAGIEGKYPQTISIKWSHPISIYRASIDWLSADTYSNDFSIIAHRPDGTTRSLHAKGNDHMSGSVSSVAFPEQISITALQFIFQSSVGQDRVLIKHIGIF